MPQSAAAAHSNRIEAETLALEKQVAKALRRVGKVSMPRDGSLSRSLTVTSPAGSYLHVTVSTDQKNIAFIARGTGVYSILVEEARDVDFVCKHRARKFGGLPARLSAETLDTIIQCVEKHLTVKDAAEAERTIREAEKANLEKVEKKRHAHFRAIAKRHGIQSSAFEHVLRDGNLSVERHRETYAVTIDGLSEADLERVLTLCRETFP